MQILDALNSPVMYSIMTGRNESSTSKIDVFTIYIQSIFALYMF